VSNTGHLAEPIFVLNRLIDMPISYAMDGCHGDRDAELYFLDYNYINQERTAACLGLPASAPSNTSPTPASR
jgi:hypothetical protein